MGQIVSHDFHRGAPSSLELDVCIFMDELFIPT